jgi:hypothetical protein
MALRMVRLIICWIMGICWFGGSVEARASASACFAQAESASFDSLLWAGSKARLSQATENLIESTNLLVGLNRTRWRERLPFLGRRHSSLRYHEERSVRACRSAWEACVYQHKRATEERLRAILALEAGSEAMTQRQRHAEAAVLSAQAASARYELEASLAALDSTGSAIRLLMTSLRLGSGSVRLSEDLSLQAIPHPMIKDSLNKLADKSLSPMGQWNEAHEVVQRLGWITSSEAIALLRLLPREINGYMAILGRHVAHEIEPLIRRGRLDPSIRRRLSEMPGGVFTGQRSIALDIVKAIELVDQRDPRSELHEAYVLATRGADSRRESVDVLAEHLIEGLSQLPQLRSE